MTHRRLLIVILFLAIFSFDLALPTDIDFWWHVRAGRLIYDTGMVPTTDPFSYTALGRSWVAHEWLWEVLVFVVYERGGYALAVIVSALILTLAYVVLYRLLRRLGTNEIVAAALVLWAAVLALPNIGVRPRELTHLFLALYVSRLLLYREGRVRHLWLLPALMVLWVNVHGGFVLGLGLVALFAVGETVHWLRSQRRLPGHLLLVGVATVAATVVNPRGPQMVLYPLSYYLGADNPSFSVVTEFQSPNFHEPLPLLFAAGLIALIALAPRGGRVSVTDFLLTAVFTLQALVSTRQISACVLVLTPLLALRLLDRFRLAGELPPVRLSRRFVALNWCILVGLLTAAGLYLSRPDVRGGLQLGAEPRSEALPVAGARFIQEQNLPAPVFNHQPWGGYLIYRWYPDRPVFIDGRIDMYGPEVVREYVDVVTLTPQWADVLARYEVRTVLIPRDSPLSALLRADDRWQRVFQGDVEDVFVRRADVPRSS